MHPEPIPEGLLPVAQRAATFAVRWLLRRSPPVRRLEHDERLQEAWVGVCSAWAWLLSNPDEPRDDLFPLFFASARNRVRAAAARVTRWRRLSTRCVQLHDHLLCKTPGPERIVLARLGLAEARELARTLPGRLVGVVSALLDGMSPAEIISTHGPSPRSARQYLFEGRLALLKRMGEVRCERRGGRRADAQLAARSRLDVG